VVHCPVCESQAVTIVLNSKPRASCSACGSTWIQEGSWQRAVRPGQRRLLLHPTNGKGTAVPTAAVDDVIVLSDPVKRPRRAATSRGEPPAQEAIAT
jgi:hypothetical protein